MCDGAVNILVEWDVQINLSTAGEDKTLDDVSWNKNLVVLLTNPRTYVSGTLFSDALTTVEIIKPGLRSSVLTSFTVSTNIGRAKAQAVSRRPPTAEAWVRSQVSPCGICGGQSGTGTCFSPSTSVFPCQFHSTGAPLLGKGHKIIIIIIVIFITVLHKKPQGCGASVASTAVPFTTKKNHK
jgi:hypothetical protein